jgi:hypothetical protein
MDKKTAVKILTKEIVKAQGQKFIADTAHKKHLLETALAYCDIEHEKPFSFKKHNIWPYSPQWIFDDAKYEELEKDYKKSLTDYCSKVADANYVFVEHSGNTYFEARWSLVSFMDTFSFFALISGSEVEYLRTTFYKNVPDEILEAFDVFKIPNFIEAYKNYLSVSGEENVLKFGMYVPFQSGMEVEIGDVTQGKTSKRYYLVEKVLSDGSIEGHRFEDESLTIPHEKKPYGDCNSDYIIPVKKYVKVDHSFFEFVFSLPYEDQNITANKWLLKNNLKKTDAFKILLKEYSQGRYFQEYFNVLDKLAQEDFVNRLNRVQEKNLVHDSFLWSSGFKNLQLDYISLYKSEAKGFIEYFKSRSIEEKRVVLKDIMVCEATNEEIIDWLNQNESDLIREVGLSDG